MGLPTASRLVVLTSALALALVGVPSASASAESETFMPGGASEFTVPAGVTQVHVTAVGGSGKAGGECLFDGYTAAGAGGAGAKIVATLSVRTLRTLYVHFGTGGAGGPSAGGCVPTGGAGGGASDVRTEPGSLASRLLVAGGGGGGGSGDAALDSEEGRFAGAGGSASGLVGGNGTNSEDRMFGFNITEANGGEGGGTSEPGKGGGGRGCSGGDGVGTEGGAGAVSSNCGSSGGGGGGYFGGGAGGGSNNDSAGGGAGSSYIAPGVTGEVTLAEVEPQEVVIGYTVPAPPKAAISSPMNGGSYVQGTLVASGFSCVEGEGGPGIESCEDSNGGSGAAGTLNTASIGLHTYTVTAKSSDGLVGEATIDYTVVAPKPAPKPGTNPLVGPPANSAGHAPTSPAACVSRRRLTIHPFWHVRLRRGARIVSAEVLLDGHLVARAKGSDPAIPVSLVGFGKGTFTIAIVARTSTGRTLRALLSLHTCVS